MRVLVIYYSRTGHTKQVAGEIVKALQCDSEEVIDTVNRAGPIGFLMAGRAARSGGLTKLKPIQKDPAGYDLVIIGTPIWAGHVSTPVRTYLAENKDKLKKVAYFVTEGSSGDEATFKDMEALSGKKAAATLVVTAADLRKGEVAGKVKAFVDAVKA